ncbi:MAG: hypothetical protein IT385_09385 [Deltaproteobacteria bacterium]|nr:hypothetical protein [Deltaproteobacteria bacterium]
MRSKLRSVVWAWASSLALVAACGGDEETGGVVARDTSAGPDLAADAGEVTVAPDVVDEDTTLVLDVPPADTTVADAIATDSTIADAVDATSPAEVATTDAPVAPDAVVGPCFGAAAAGHRKVTCGDIGFDVEVPAACLVPGACGLIVDIHGWTMTADLEDLNTGMRARGGAAGYVVVQPTAPGLAGIPTWDLGRHADDIHDFVVEVQAVLATDPDRSHVMGFSQGGALTWTLVCDHADFYASAAPIGALPGCQFKGGDVPAREVDVLAVHGRQDSVVQFSQHVSQRDAALDHWPFGDPTVFREDDDHKATRWTTPSGTVFESWEHDYEAQSIILRGHCFPGSEHLGGGLQLTFGCTAQGTFDFGEIALAFFQAHAR